GNLAGYAERSKVIDLSIHHRPTDSGGYGSLRHLREPRAYRMADYCVWPNRRRRLDGFEELLTLVDCISLGIDHAEIEAKALRGIIGNPRLLALILVLVVDERYQNLQFLHRRLAAERRGTPYVLA